MSTPCIIIARDRLSLLRRCLASLLEYRDRLEIHIVDHGSTWPAMCTFLEDFPGVPVHRRGSLPPRALWEWDGLAGIVADRPYLVTDPDIVLDPACPKDWLDRLHYELNHFDVIKKVGLGLRIDDLPDTPLGRSACAWECGFWQERSSLRSWVAPVDTTLALHRPLSQVPTFALVPAIRLDAPYLIRHLPWYGDDYPEESAYYREHLIPGSSHWAHGGWPT